MIRHSIDTPENTSLSEETDVWIIARRLRLLSSKDSTVTNLARYQLNETIISALGEYQVNIIEFLSGRSKGELFAYRYNSSGANL